MTICPLALFAGCAKTETETTAQGKDTTAKDTTKATEAQKSDFKVGMVTDSGTIDDKSFNQGTWEGVEKAAKDLKGEAKYVKPAGQTEAHYLTEIGNLYDAGFKTIVTPGFLFTEAITTAQDKYKDANFVAIDFAPATIGKNTVSITFAEHQAGFMAGLAAALQLKEGEFGGIYGMAIPPVQKFNWGFQQGVKYANEKYSTKVSLKEENLVYVGKFDAPDQGQQLAAQMYDRGVKNIFIAAGLTGTGAITEAKTRKSGGADIWAIGVDVDQYEAGVYKDGKSIFLTSAMKCIDKAAYDMVAAAKDGKFPGGTAIVYDAAKDGVGIPKKNPNLSDDVQKTCDEVFELIKTGKLVVADTSDGLIK